MSSPERKSKSMKIRLGFALVASAMVLQACTVRPLYYNPPAGSGTASMASTLSSVAIKPMPTRQGQEVRNHLTFLMYGGAKPAATEYSLDLTVGSIVEVATTTQVTTLDNEPTAATVTMVGSYAIREASTGKVVASGRREATSSYDVPRQEYAALRATRDAENRSARELAEMLHLAVAQDLARK